MTELSAGRAVSLAASELAEASKALQAVERALIRDAAPVDSTAFPRDLQQLDLLSQMIDELRIYLDRLAMAIGTEEPRIDLSSALTAVRLGDMRRRLADTPRGESPTISGQVDLF
ncbi:hypothetical protein [Histidinibacterium aquaticum]|uniref:Uncharacterized protein n=1 Tax=Histidinibacterium aquaticum TaxID=2613962 RepID=A0A5J5GJR3_9RHOB|nr:hypothetical protein [Histidinibacterium aquaticum]KAA9007968.1 hypothetical protein F3S47_10660 [Histidinibacterium aquaticum]